MPQYEYSLEAGKIYFLTLDDAIINSTKLKIDIFEHTISAGEAVGGSFTETVESSANVVFCGIVHQRAAVLSDRGVGGRFMSFIINGTTLTVSDSGGNWLQNDIVKGVIIYKA